MQMIKSSSVYALTISVSGCRNRPDYPRNHGYAALLASLLNSLGQVKLSPTCRDKELLLHQQPIWEISRLTCNYLGYCSRRNAVNFRRKMANYV